MKPKTISEETRQIRIATALVHLGARLQVLESETTLPRERLLKLYKEVRGESPPKGMLPFSTDWFMTWQPNIHASLFMNLYQALDKSLPQDEIDVIIKACRLYLEQVRNLGMEPVLSITRAWRLVKFFNANMLTLTNCRRCTGRFVVHTNELVDSYVCGLCNLPSRAGKTKLAGKLFREDDEVAPTMH